MQSKTKTEDNWIRIERVENAIDNLEMTIYFLKTFPGIKKWKWAVIALHQTLYSFFIVALVNCSQQNNIVNKQKRLITISQAAEMLGSQEVVAVWDNAKPLVMSSDQAGAFVALVRLLRNNFEHFNTDYWSIEISMIEDIFRKLAPVLHFVILESNTIWFTEEQETIVTELLYQVANLIDN